MHVILTPVGSAGDVNPFVVIGRELRRRGHRVSLLAPETFAAVVSNAGLEFVPLGTAEEYERATSNPDLWDSRRGPRVVFSVITGQLRRAYATLERVYEPGRTLLVGHPLAFFTRVFEEQHGVPSVTVHLAPSMFRSDFRQPALPSGHDLSGWPRWTKRALWWAVDRFAIDPLVAPSLNAWRAELGLPPVSRVFDAWIHSPQRALGLFPDWFGDPQPDWPSQLRLTGFILSDAGCTPGAALEPTLAGGDAPIVVTPGSANRHAARFFRAAIDATARLGRPVLLVTPYRGHLPASLPAHAIHVPSAPFATLFPRAAAVVHHGGIGTSAQALAAGVPQVVMPMGFDQPDNAKRIARLGVGEAIRPSRFSGPRVGAALERLLGSEAVGDACRRWRDRIDAAANLTRACDLIEAQFGA